MACTLTALAYDDMPDSKIVKMGWQENCYGLAEKGETRVGISFDYQEELAHHLGWRCDYVSGTWASLLNALGEGRIDVLPFVTKSPERMGKMLFSDEPMGRERYEIVIMRKNAGIVAGKPGTLNGKRIGVNRGSYSEITLRRWLDRQGIKAKVVEVDGDDDARAKFKKGMFDAFIGFGSHFAKDMEPVCRIDSADVYFAFNIHRSDLKAELDKMVKTMHDADTCYMDHVHGSLADRDLYRELMPAQRKWLMAHGPVKVGYAKDNLAYCAKDEKTGKLIGGLETLLGEISSAFHNIEIDFEPVAFDTHRDMLDAMRRGEIDCAFPLYSNQELASENGCMVSAPMLESTMFAITTKAGLNESDSNVVAVLDGNVSKKWFVSYYYPQWKIKTYASVKECEQALRRGEADCLLYSSYQAYLIIPSLDFYRLPLSRHVLVGFGVNKDEPELLGILNRSTHVVSMPDVFASMTKYAATTRQFSVWEFCRTYYKEVIVIGVIILLGFAMLSLLLYFNSVKLKKAVRVALHARKVQERFLQNMSHELRTPLNCICGFSQILCMKEMRDSISDEELDEYGKIITSNTEMLTTLVSDILDISDFESGKYKLLLSDTDINDMCRSASYMVSSRLPDGVKQRIESDVPDGTMLYTDKRRVCQVLTNFLTNAYKHTTKGEVVIGVSTTAHPGNITFSVTDTGMGVPPELQDKIFNRFEKGISSLRGIGLGLNICVSISEALNGQVYLDREYKNGARFVFVHPCNLKEVALPGADGVSVVRSGEKARRDN